MERGEEPLDDPSPTSLIRREFLHGQGLTSDEVVQTYGVSNGLLAQIVSNMAQWGFQFTKTIDPGTNTTRFYLKNRDHVPVTRDKTLRRDTGRPGAGVRDRIKTSLLNGTTLTTKEAVARFGGGVENLRHCVDQLQKQGYTFDIQKQSNLLSYRVVSGPGYKHGRDEEDVRDEEEPDRLPVRQKQPAAKTLRQPMVDLELPVAAPRFGSHLQVYLLNLAEDEGDGDGESILVGLKSDEGNWLARIEAFVPPKSEL